MASNDLRDLLHAVAQEAHTMGRIYERVEQPRSPAEEFERVNAMADTFAARLSAPPQPSAGVVPEEVREAARETLEVYDLPEHTKTMAHWILSLTAPPEPRD